MLIFSKIKLFPLITVQYHQNPCFYLEKMEVQLFSYAAKLLEEGQPQLFKQRNSVVHKSHIRRHWPRSRKSHTLIQTQESSELNLIGNLYSFLSINLLCLNFQFGKIDQMRITVHDTKCSMAANYFVFACKIILRSSCKPIGCKVRCKNNTKVF